MLDACDNRHNPNRPVVSPEAAGFIDAPADLLDLNGGRDRD